MRFRPELFVSVLVDVRNLLNGTPTENGVVADERCDVAVRDGVLDSRVDEVCEEGDAVLKVSVDNLHDARRKLHDT